MTTIRAVALAALWVAVTLVPSGTAMSQGPDEGTDTREPRFLLAVAGTRKPIDVQRTPSLSRHLALDLDGVPLPVALEEISRQSGLRLAYTVDVLPPAARVRLRASEISVAGALSAVLLDAGVDVVFTRAGQATLVRRIAVAPPGSITGRVTDAKTGEGLAGAEVFLVGTRWRTRAGDAGRYQIADVEAGSYTLLTRRIGYEPDRRAVTVSGGQESIADVALQTAATKLGEIVVTSQKREERLQDVPVPVTAIAADKLVDKNQLRIQDFYTSIPGLSVTPQASYSSQYLTIRGITTGAQAVNPTVGITVDDVPYGPSTADGGGGLAPVPDIDPGDLARVEVLRGPQGTLYGASSLGGLLKFVTVDPSTEAFSGRVQAGASSVYNGAEAGYNFRASVNAPVSSTLAVRASGFTRKDPGYINNPVLDIDGVNKDDAYGGRVSALWRPSQTFSLKLGALLQKINGDGSVDVNVLPGLGDLQQSYLRGTGGFVRKAQAYSAIGTAKVGRAELTGVSAYNINEYHESADLTSVLGAFTEQQFGVTGTPAPDRNKTDKFSDEVRLSAPLGPRLDLRLGGFYTHEISHFGQEVFAADSATGAVVGQWATATGRNRYEEYAAFADLTFHVTNRFDVQIGGRESHIEVASSSTLIGPYLTVVFGQPSEVDINPEVHAKANAFTYLVTPQFKVSTDLMVYARLASGYRPGGPNPAQAVLPQYNPDKTRNYELGVKGDFLSHRLSLDASLYHIDWKDIQIFLLDPVTFNGYTTNGSRAKSQGIELSVESRPLTGLTIAAWGAWDHAVLTQPIPPTSTALGAPGDRLPYSSRFSGNLSLEEDFPLSSRVTGFVGGEVSYVGDRVGEFANSFASSPQRQDLPAYTKADLRAGGRYDSWTLNFFIDNVADKRGLLSGGLNLFPYFAFVYTQPRMVGLSLARAF